MLKHYRNMLIATALAASLGTIKTGSAGEITIEDAWVRSAPPVATVLAGYMTIHNHTGKAITLTAVSSPAFGSAELHRTTLHNGMMHMEAVKELVIKEGETVKLEPNGYHLMLNNPKQKIRTGDTIPFTLKFDGQTEETTATVKQDGQEEESQPHHHHH